MRVRKCRRDRDDRFALRSRIRDVGRAGGYGRRHSTGSPRQARQLPDAQPRGEAPQSLAGGALVSRVARRHDLNTNQLFTWRKRYVEGRLGPVGVANAPGLLAVRVGEAESTERKTQLATTAASVAEAGWMETEADDSGAS
jgi:hypothetical protein